MCMFYLLNQWTVRRRIFNNCFMYIMFQILEVNGQSMLNISHNKALELLRKTTHLSITVKSNLLGKFYSLMAHYKFVSVKMDRH